MEFSVTKTTTVELRITDEEGEYLKDLLSRVSRSSENFKGQNIRKDIEKALVDFKDVDRWTYQSLPQAAAHVGPPIAPIPPKDYDPEYREPLMRGDE